MKGECGDLTALMAFLQRWRAMNFLILLKHYFPLLNSNNITIIIEAITNVISVFITLTGYTAFLHGIG